MSLRDVKVGDEEGYKAHVVAKQLRQDGERTLRAFLGNLHAARDFSALTDDEVRDLTATLNAAAEKMEKKP